MSTAGKSGASATGGMTAELDLPSATDMRAAIERHNEANLAHAAKLKKAAEEEKKHQREAFLADRLTPDFIKLVMARVRAAAESGEKEVMIGQFPADLCTDGGRRINAEEDGWPDTLQGIAREFYEFWEQELKPRGFHLRAEIVSFPDGLTGDVGAFLSW
jgi:hypothetical protein